MAYLHNYSIHSEGYQLEHPLPNHGDFLNEAALIVVSAAGGIAQTPTTTGEMAPTALQLGDFLLQETETSQPFSTSGSPFSHCQVTFPQQGCKDLHSPPFLKNRNSLSWHPGALLGRCLLGWSQAWYSLTRFFF